MDTPVYDRLEEQAQVETLRGVALEAAERFGLEVARLEVVLHGYNTTFSLVTGTGRRLALRVNVNSKAGPAEVAAQQAWVHALAHETGILVPDVVLAPDGSSVASVECAEMGRSVLVVVNTWLDGPDVGECDVVVAGELGSAMATMHQHARTWSMPEGANLPLYDEPLCGDEDLLAGLELSAADRAVLHEADARGRAAFAEAALVAPAIPLHADLHGGNLKWDGRRLAVFDFDDAGRGVPAFDLAVATFYLRGGDPSVEQALRAGYERAGPLPELGDEAFEALVAARQLLLLNSLYATSTATWRSEADEYLLTTLARLRAWRASGRFRLDVPVPRRSPP